MASPFVQTFSLIFNELPAVCFQPICQAPCSKSAGGDVKMTESQLYLGLIEIQYLQ